MKLSSLSKKSLCGLTACFLILDEGSCSDTFCEQVYDPTPPQTRTLTRAVPTLYFDWENVDWMPTPAGQSRIPTPWVGQGSLAGSYDLTIVNDHKASDGWELLYSTFDP